MYLKLEGSKVIGFLRIGFKRLFFWNELNKIQELTPLCVLDFYVNEEYQRNGFGKVKTNYKNNHYSIFLIAPIREND